MASIYTGLSERSHGCRHFNNRCFGLDPEMPTIATILRERGYSTAGFMQSDYLGNTFGMDIGYDSFWICVSEGAPAMDSVAVDTLLNYYRNNEIPFPFLATIHLYDPHSPYVPPSPFDNLYDPSGINGSSDWPADSTLWHDPKLIEHLEALYASEIRWCDSQISRLFRDMRYMGLLENTIVILVADHGEEFMEHGSIGHAANLYQETVDIPLIISGPGIDAGMVITQNVGHFDVMPTLLEYLNIPVPDHVEGINLLGSIPADRVIPSSGIVFGPTAAACLQNSRKVMWFTDSDSSETYDLAEDPSEQHHLPTDSLLLQQVLDYWAWPCICTPTEPDDSAAVANKLRDLGYIR